LSALLPDFEIPAVDEIGEAISGFFGDILDIVFDISVDEWKTFYNWLKE
jgi:hypothetical protein